MMKEMYDYYDKHFFYGLLGKQVKPRGISFEVSNKATRAAGSARIGKPIRVMLSAKVFDRITSKNASSLKVNGLHIVNRVDAIMNVMEHELTHVALLSSEINENSTEGHGSLFKSIVSGLFGHTTTTHQLILADELVGEQCLLVADNVKIGDTVRFSVKDKSVSGVVIKKNPKRAKVKVGSLVYSVAYDSLFMCNEKLPPAATPIVISAPPPQPLAKDKFRVGDKVKFSSRSSIMSGSIVKMNPKNSVVKVTTGELYNVPYNGLQKV